jgi:hypothetical protein
MEMNNPLALVQIEEHISPYDEPLIMKRPAHDGIDDSTSSMALTEIK